MQSKNEIKILKKEELSLEAKRVLIRGSKTWQIRVFHNGGIRYNDKEVISECVSAEFEEFIKCFRIDDIMSSSLFNDDKGEQFSKLYCENAHSIIEIAIWHENKKVSNLEMIAYTNAFDAEKERRVKLPAWISSSKYHDNDDRKEIFDAFGICIENEDTEAEILDVILPENWFFQENSDNDVYHIHTTGYLYDEQLRERAYVILDGIENEIRFSLRYGIDISCHTEKDENGRCMTGYKACVTDCGIPFETIYEWEKEFGCIDEANNSDKGWQMCHSYLSEHFPKWLDILAYWEKE